MNHHKVRRMVGIAALAMLVYSGFVLWPLECSLSSDLRWPQFGLSSPILLSLLTVAIMYLVKAPLEGLIASLGVGIAAAVSGKCLPSSSITLSICVGIALGFGIGLSSAGARKLLFSKNMVFGYICISILFAFLSSILLLALLFLLR